MKKFIIGFHRRVVLRSAECVRGRLGENCFTALLGVCIGVVTALVTGGAHYAVSKLSCWCSAAYSYASGAGFFYAVPVLLLPLLGLVSSNLVQRFLGNAFYAKSLSPLILSISRKRTNIPYRECVSHLLSAALSVGLGGSAGMEAPGVLAGAAIGNAGASLSGETRSRRPVLLGCGAAAAIAAIFRGPVAGVLFAAEVLLPEFSISALIPMLLSSASAAVVSRALTHDADLFTVRISDWQYSAIPLYFLLGVFCAAVGVYVIRCSYAAAGWLKSRFRSPVPRLFCGGFALCLLLWLFPVLYGQGYGSIGMLFTGDTAALSSAPLSPLGKLPPALLFAVMLAAAVLLKTVATVLTVESGGDGGIFAPSMFIGAFTGYIFAGLVNLTGFVQLQEFNFVAVGMCGVFTAVMRAPLTGIFLIAEITGGYMLLVPLMIGSSVAFFVARRLEPNSIYRKALIENGLLSDARDMSVLQGVPVRLNLDTGYHPLRVDTPLSELSSLVSASPSDTVFPVLDERRRLLGIVHLEKVLSVMLDPEVYSLLLVLDLMESPAGVISPDDDLARAMWAAEQYNLKHLPVCDAGNVFLGFVSQPRIFSKYRRALRDVENF